MKYLIIVPDGAADYPLDSLGGRTPLEAAYKPHMNELARSGILGRVTTVPQGYIPSSDVANLSLLGYEPAKHYCARGPLEAANLGIELGPDDVALRCNLITESEGKILDYSAGHITDKEADILMECLNRYLGSEQIEFYPGTSYRNLMVARNAGDSGLDKLTYVGPHDIMGRDIQKHLPRGKGSEFVNDLMNRSRAILKDHEVNNVRVDLGENPANMIWLWACGRKPSMPAFKEHFGISGAVISAVDLIKGIGKVVGMEVVDVPGANGYYDTNYEGKAQAALAALQRHDFVFVHVEAPDEAGHNGDLLMKITCLERIDKMIVGTLCRGLAGMDYRMMVVPDHPTPVAKRTHTDEPVPFVMCGAGINSGGFRNFCENEAAGSDFYFDSGAGLLKFFLKS